MAILSWQITDGQTAEQPIGPSPLRVGRAEGNDIIIPDPSVSSAHAELSMEQGNLVVRDLGSTNGTFVFNQRVQQALIESGQAFRFGNVELVFKGDTPAVQSPQIPVPAPTRPRLSVSAHTPAAAAVAVSAPPQETSDGAMVSGPLCSHHPDAKALYTCPKCTSDLCPQCVKMEQIGPRQVPFCRACGSKCVPQGQSAVPAYKPRPKFGEMLPSAFTYPFKGNGLILLITGTLFFGFLDAITSSPVAMASIAGWFVRVIFYGYLFAYMQNVVTASANGEDSPPTWPDVTDIGQDIIHPFVLFFGCLLASFAPGFILYLSEPLAGNALMLLGAFYFPMALLAVAMADSLGGLNPLVVLSAILRVPAQYIVAVIVCGLLVLVRSFLPGVIEKMEIPIIPYFVLAFFGLLLIMMEMRILGILYYTNKEKFGWFR